MSQEAPPGDLLFGSAVLAVFLVFVFALGYAIYKFKNLRFTRAWAPLVPLIQGTVSGDGGGGTTSWLTGTYRGHRVQAGMVPHCNRYSGETGFYYNHFEVALLGVAGRLNWNAEVKTAILGFGRTGWTITADDPALVARLEAAGVLSLVARFGEPTVAYQKSARRLAYSEDVTPLWIPPPERFLQELDLLLELAKINAEVNPG